MTNSTRTTSPLRGLANISYFADDIQAARDWYTDFLGIAPYFESGGAYFEFRIGDDHDELGLIDAKWAPPGAGGSGGPIAYWHVDDVFSVYERLLELGAIAQDEPRERGEGFITASVIDPFGNQLGVMQNPNWLERH
ncbi:VOC family protein [Microbacteriaceae bacterium VKM Ac-2855]|nr:VOC family protein [Microbacteriaceae bacterium VKM Ac-2855]